MKEKSVMTNIADLPKAPVTSGDMAFNRTGLWRYLMMSIRDRTAPCQAACPLGMPSPGFINDLILKEPNRALDRIMEINPLPGITGRLCYHPCQSKCLRRELDGTVHIQMLERYLADTASDPAISAPKNLGAQVMVLGAGPLGLSAAYFLGRMGISVTIADPLDQAGGFLAAMETNRLPKEILCRETDRLIRLANIRPMLGDEFFGLNSVSTDHGWRLIIHDQTAHNKDSDPAKSLDVLSSRLSMGRQLLDTVGVGPRGAYKASQVASALAAGRELASQALSLLGFSRESQEINKLSSSDQKESSISARDVRYELFDRQDSVCADPKTQTLSDTQALDEAKRCLSCGHCNLCGRCLVFCPDVSLSINKQRTKIEVDEMHCKGCGICAYECPRRAITMER